MKKFHENGKTEFSYFKEGIDAIVDDLVEEQRSKIPAPIEIKSKDDFIIEYKNEKKVSLDTKQATIDKLSQQIEDIQTGINKIPDTLFFSSNAKRTIADEVASIRINENIQIQNVYDRAERVFGDMSEYGELNFLKKIISLLTRGFGWRQDSYKELLIILKSMETILRRERESYSALVKQIDSDARQYADTEYKNQMIKVAERQKTIEETVEASLDYIKKYVEKNISQLFNKIEN